MDEKIETFGEYKIDYNYHPEYEKPLNRIIKQREPNIIETMIIIDKKMKITSITINSFLWICTNYELITKYYTYYSILRIII